MKGKRGDLIVVFTDWRTPVILVRTAHLLEVFIFSKIRVEVWWDNEEGNGNPLQYSCLGNPTNRGAWQATVHRVSKSWTQLSN